MPPDAMNPAVCAVGSGENCSLRGSENSSRIAQSAHRIQASFTEDEEAAIASDRRFFAGFKSGAIMFVLPAGAKLRH
jgi:hypothetical protein